MNARDRAAYERAGASQRAAADPAKSVFVTANAGSGKTKVLVDRIARLLLAGAAPSSFVCITYTKAAAAEMQRRLFERLGQWCVAPDEELTRDLQTLIGDARPFDAAMLVRARALFARALEAPGGLKIQTIHAFCERLLGRFPLEAGVPPGFEIADDARAAEMRADAIALLVRAGAPDALAAVSTLAARLHDARFQAALARIMEARGEIGAFARRFENAEAARAAILLRHDAPVSGEALMAECLAAMDWAKFARAAEALAESGTKDGDLATRIEAARAQPSFEALCAIFCKDDGELRRDAPTKKLRKAEPWLDVMFSDAGEQGCVARTAEGVKRWRRAQDSIAALDLALALDGTYAHAKARSGVLDFADLIERAHALLTRSAAAAWVLHKLDGGVDHILIDEGQDTSPAQWGLIEPLQAEFFSGAGAREKVRTVFAVGDHKQSIYSFQGADPAGFLAQAQALSARAHAAGRAFESHNLEMSFRSTPEVLKVVDATFRNLPLGGDAPGKHDILRHTAKRAHEKGVVQWWPLAPRLQARDANPWHAPLDMERADSAVARLAAEIAARTKAWIEDGQGVWEIGKLRPMHAGDVLVLVRSRGPLFRQTLKAFKRVGLPVAGADRMVLKNELAVEDCLTLLRVAADPGDDLALACLLKGPWIGLVDDDADLFPLAFGRGKGEGLWARLLEAKEPKYAAARTFVRQLIDRTGAAPHALLSFALEHIDEEGRSGWERLFARLGEEARDPVEELLARALAAHQRGPATLRAFLAQIEAEEAEVRREMDEAGGCVRVMTVHGAKGLEAPVVFLPDTSSPPQARNDETVFVTPDGPIVSAARRDDDAVSAQAREEAERRTRSEHLRLLYVAMTRARDRLIVCGYEDGRFANGAAQGAWHGLVGDAVRALGHRIETPFGPGVSYGEGRKEASGAIASGAQAPLPDWVRAPLAPRAAAAGVAPSQLKGEPPAFSPLRDEAKRFRRGLLIHGLLQRLPDIAPDARAAAARAWLERQGVAKAEAGPLADETLAIVGNRAFAPLFGADSRAETPIVGVVRGYRVRGVVDRLVVRADAVEILDFKSDRPAATRPEDAPEAYVLQMALYRAVLQSIFPDRAIGCALLWTEKPALTRLEPARLARALDAFFAVEAA